MDDIQQRIIEIALQIPGYLGYEAKERRRDMDKYMRMQLAAKYDAENTHLARIARNAPIKYAVSLENVDQKLERLLARFRTAPRGYAGWFDSAQIVEQDLDALTQFDATLTDGVARLETTIDKIGTAMRSGQGVEDAISASAELLDTLNTQFDQRENLLATGKKPTLDLFTNIPSPLSALQTQSQSSADFQALADLKMNDAVSFDGTDFIVSGKITYNDAGQKFWSFMLKDRSQERWLRVGPDEEVAVCDEIKITVPSPLPDSLEQGGSGFAKDVSGTAKVTVEGAGGTRRGSADYGRFIAKNARLWVEDFGQGKRAMLGQTVDASDLKVYRR